MTILPFDTKRPTPPKFPADAPDALDFPWDPELGKPHGEIHGLAAFVEKNPAPVVKYDEGKLRFDLLPPDALAEVVKAFMAGLSHPARVPHDWANGTNWTRYWASGQRHEWAYRGGEDLDPDSKVHHLAHAAANNLILLAYALRKIGTDDR